MSVEKVIQQLLAYDMAENKSVNNETLDLRQFIKQNSKMLESPITDWINVLICYSLIVLVSFFGNSIVCKIIFGDPAMRSTTNIYIGNLSISDLLMTVFNIPLQLIHIISKNYPLNNFFCKCMPFFQGLSVNVSSFTMACIALDRYQVIAYPLKPRPTMTSIILKLIFIWIVAALVSSPYPALSAIEDDFTIGLVTRCRLIYPEPKTEMRQALTMITMAIQYLGPLMITGYTYSMICCIIWNRISLGEVSEREISKRYMAKWKTIKMLIIVFVVFAVCWFPLNMYHIYQDFRSYVGYNKHNSMIFLSCHWLAMSSVCYNPFVYCWLNEKFRMRTKSYLLWFKRNSQRQSNALHQKTNSGERRYRFPRKSSSASGSTQSKLSYRLHSLLLKNSNENRKKLSELKMVEPKLNTDTNPLANYLTNIKSNIELSFETCNPFTDLRETKV